MTQSIKPGEWILIKASPLSIQAVVCFVHPNNTISAVYTDDQTHAMMDDFQWVNDCWEFVHSGPTGVRAEGNPTLERFVMILQLGQQKQGKDLNQIRSKNRT